MTGKPLQDPPAQIDRAVELKAKWCMETGQLWQIGPHRLLCADFRETGEALVDLASRLYVGDRAAAPWSPIVPNLHGPAG